MSQATQKPVRRWFQFSLRTLLVITAAAAGLAFAWMKTVEPYRLQRQAIAVITKLGGTYKTEDATGWVRYLDWNAQDVVVVDLADCDAPSEYLPLLARLPRLKALVIGGHSVRDRPLMALERMKSLRGLVLDSTKVSDEGVAELNKACHDLVVYKSERRACIALQALGGKLQDQKLETDTEPAWLRAEVGDAYFVRHAWFIILEGRGISDAETAWLPNLSDIRGLALHDTSVTGRGFAFLSGLKSLKCLWLAGTKITDKDIPHFEKCGQLTFLELGQFGISPEGMMRLRSALPHCDIRD